MPKTMKPAMSTPPRAERTQVAPDARRRLASRVPRTTAAIAMARGLGMRRRRALSSSEASGEVPAAFPVFPVFPVFAASGAGCAIGRFSHASGCRAALGSGDFARSERAKSPLRGGGARFGVRQPGTPRSADGAARAGRPERTSAAATVGWSRFKGLLGADSIGHVQHDLVGPSEGCRRGVDGDEARLRAA